MPEKSCFVILCSYNVLHYIKILISVVNSHVRIAYDVTIDIFFYIANLPSKMFLTCYRVIVSDIFFNRDVLLAERTVSCYFV